MIDHYARSLLGDSFHGEPISPHLRRHLKIQTRFLGPSFELFIYLVLPADFLGLVKNSPEECYEANLHIRLVIRLEASEYKDETNNPRDELSRSNVGARGFV